MKNLNDIRIDFSLRREVFFVVIGAVAGAISMIVPRMIFEAQMGLPYYLTWIAFGHIVGVYSSFSVLAGITIHMMTAVSIGIVVGIFLYKSGILNISKISNGLIYGFFSGTIVFVIFFIPIYQFVLAPEIARTMTEMDPSMTESDAKTQLAGNFLQIIVSAIIMHLVFGITLGLISSLLSIKFGTRYRCPNCDISFSRIDSYQKHRELVHGAQPITLNRVLILGGGFGGVEVLRSLQKEFQDDVSVDITLVSRDNFFLFTPMLPEVSSGMIETRNILTPVRAFCNRARFYDADVESIDLKSKEVVITHAIGKQTRPNDLRRHKLTYDNLVLALGSETNYFGMSDVAEHAFTINNIETENWQTVNPEEVKKRSSWYMKIKVSSIGSVKAIEKAILDFKMNWNIYKLTQLSEINFPSDKDFFSSKFVAKCEDQFLNYLFDFTDTTISIDSIYNRAITDLNSNVTKRSKNKQLNDVESRLMNGMEVYGMIDRHTPIHIRFLLCVISLEGLLLDGDDKLSGIQKAFCQKITYLIGHSKEILPFIYDTRLDQITEKFAIVTGGNNSIGLATAKAFANG